MRKFLSLEIMYSGFVEIDDIDAHATRHEQYLGSSFFLY